MTLRKTHSIRAARETARALAAEAGVADLAPAAGRGDPASGLLATLLAHELAAGHRLMMRLAGRADAFLDRASSTARAAPTSSRCAPPRPRAPTAWRT
jgi:hypothetical protein